MIIIHKVTNKNGNLPNGNVINGNDISTYNQSYECNGKITVKSSIVPS